MFQIKRDEFTYLPMNRLRRHPHEPPARDRDVRALCREIEQSKMISALQVTPWLADTYLVLDGNRRFRAAELLQVTTLPCQIHRDVDDVNVAFCHLNSRVRAMRSNDWMSFIADTEQNKWADLLALAPKMFASQFKRLVEQVGASYVIELAKAGTVGPYVSIMGDRITAALDRFDQRIKVNDAVRWIVSHRMQNEMNILLRGAARGDAVALGSSNVRRIARCIRKDEPYGSREKGSRRTALRLAR